METTLNMIVFGLVLILSNHVVVGALDHVSDDLGVRELRSMLTTTMEQNRRLEQQNRQMKLIWKGLQQMCSALQFKPSEENNFHVEDTSDVTEDNEDKHNTNETFRITHIESSGLRKDGCLQLSVQYHAPDQHTTEWLRYLGHGQSTTSSGTKKITKVGKARKYFTTSVNMCNAILNRTIETYLRVYSANESIKVVFNKTAILKSGMETLPEASTVMLSFEPSYQAKANEDLNVTIVVNGSLHNPRVSSAIRMIEIYFQGLNTSSMPPSMFDKFEFTNDISSVAIERDNATSNYVIELKSDYIQYGGILIIELLHPYPLYGFARKLYFGQNIHILSPSTRKVVPYQSFGVYALPKQTLLSGPSVTIRCASLGWPRPDVTILKRYKTGYEQKLRMDGKMIQQYIIVGTLTVRPRQKDVGKYVCRASQGNRTLETTTEAIVYVPVVFDDAKTAVLKNTTRKMVISCKASGIPRPELTLRTPSGADLTKLGYSVAYPPPRKSTTRLIVTVSPVDTSLTHVTCSANQGSTTTPSRRRIPVFPNGLNTTYVDYPDY